MPETSGARVVHVQREPYDVYIGRAVGSLKLPASKWGNPFRVTAEVPREQAIEQYREYLLGNPELMAALPELRRKVLACWCSPKACHGNVLVELANREEPA